MMITLISLSRLFLKDFEWLLTNSQISTADCTGCRQGSTTCLPTCTIRTCFKEKGVDFCGECTDFPCERSPFPGQFKQRWIEMNQRIREVGAEHHYEEQLKKSRYGGA